MIRLLAIALFFWIVIVLVRNYFKRAARVRQQPGQPTRIGTMVRCELCGLHVPESEAVKKNGQYYCSLQHRDEIENRIP